MRALDLLNVAEDLVALNKGKPKQAHLRRALSTAYYALFHTLARCCADTLIGSSGADRSPEAWSQVYRALEHGVAKNACINGKLISRFPQEIQDFANAFVQMQIKRHDADYDPNYRLFKSSVVLDIQSAAAVIDYFNNVPIKHRRAFAAFVTLKHRTS